MSSSLPCLCRTSAKYSHVFAEGAVRNDDATTFRSQVQILTTSARDGSSAAESFPNTASISVRVRSPEIATHLRVECIVHSQCGTCVVSIALWTNTPATCANYYSSAQTHLQPLKLFEPAHTSKSKQQSTLPRTENPVGTYRGTVEMIERLPSPWTTHID